MAMPTPQHSDRLRNLSRTFRSRHSTFVSWYDIPKCNDDFRGRGVHMAETEGTSQNVRAVTRALAVLNSFAGKSAQSLAEVTNATGLDKGTTRRLLLTLMKSGFVAQDPVSQHYRLGRAVRDLAANVADELDLRSIAQPVLTELAGELHVTAFLSVYDDGAMVCLDRIHGIKAIEVNWVAVGGTLPCNCGG